MLVAEKIGDSGVDLLREHFDVELGFDWTREELAERLGDFDGILIRSASKLDARLLERSGRLRAIGRPASASTTSTSPRRPSAESSSPTPRSPT